MKGGAITTSLNLPAQSFYQSRKPLLDLCDRASIKQVIFYCGESFGSVLFLTNMINESRLVFGPRTTLC
jgi:hypothetical protein